MRPFLAILVGVSMVSCTLSCKGEESAPVQATKTNAALPAKFHQALEQGRSLAQLGQYTESVAAFEQALAAVANEPRALSELSWSHLRLGHFKKAEETARQSIAGAQGNLKAASLYNLGRALEAQDMPTEAIAAHGASLLLRDNRAVATRLQWLTAKDGHEPSFWIGPATSINKLRDNDALSKDFKVERIDGALAAPFLEVAVLRIDPKQEPRGHIAVRLATGWFVSPPFFEQYVPGMYPASGRVDLVEILSVGQAGSATSVLKLYTTSHEKMRHESYMDNSVTYCALGPSQLLSCTPFIPTKVEFSHQPVGAKEPEIGDHYEFTVTLDKTGKLAVTSVGAKAPANYQNQVGETALHFP